LRRIPVIGHYIEVNGFPQWRSCKPAKPLAGCLGGGAQNSPRRQQSKARSVCGAAQSNVVVWCPICALQGGRIRQVAHGHGAGRSQDVMRMWEENQALMAKESIRFASV
jgi:hypothetical protein